VIIFVINNLDIGGCERHLATIIPYIHRQWPIRVLIMDHVPGFFSGSLTEKGITVECILKSSLWGRSFPGKNFFMKVAKLWNLTKEFKKISHHDPIIHCFLPGAYMIGAAASRIVGLKTLVMSRRSLNKYQHWPWKSIERHCHRWLAKAVGNSHLVVHQLEEEGILKERLTLIYNGIDAQTFYQPQLRESTRHMLRFAPNEVVIIHIANLISYKGHRDLIEAISLLETDLNVRILCVGEDRGIRRSLEEQALAQGVSHRVSFLGARQDIAALLSCADISVLPSHEEGFPNAILEAMAAGLPVVATSVGGNQEAVLHETTGLLIPPHAPLELASALKRLILSPDLRRHWGEAGRQRVQENFSLTSCVKNYEKLYTHLMDHRQKSSGNEP
jgi:glycosyltransferase involved in cell wall biosynthesis